jgi:uncharacterized protein involved in type VI secretion and phage assembly
MSLSDAARLARPSAWANGFVHPQVAEVVSVDDPAGLARVRVRLFGPDPDGDAGHWARVATCFAGDNRGAYLIPDVGDEVLVVFVGGDPARPVVVGSLWNGATEVPETQAASGIDRWSLTGKNGTRLAIVEAGQGSEKVEIETPNGTTAVVTDQGGGKITLRAAGTTVTIDPSGVTVQTGATVSVDASAVTITAGMVSVDSGLAVFSGLVQCSTLLTNSVISPAYTPGAGNVW